MVLMLATGTCPLLRGFYSRLLSTTIYSNSFSDMYDIFFEVSIVKQLFPLQSPPSQHNGCLYHPLSTMVPPIKADLDHHEWFLLITAGRFHTAAKNSNFVSVLHVGKNHLILSESDNTHTFVGPCVYQDRDFLPKVVISICY